VTFAGPLAGRGVVVVDHGSTRTTYEPVSATIRRGEVVARGQPIGVLELSRSHCLPVACLHWGWIRGDTYLDPLLLVGGGPVRLLPLWRGPPATGIPVPVAVQPFAVVAAEIGNRGRPGPRRTGKARPRSEHQPPRGFVAPARLFAMHRLLM